MEEEFAQLKDLVAQLQAENLRLRKEREDSQPGTSAASTSSSAPGPSSVHVPITERLIYLPRDRKCPMFSGRTGVSTVKWVEEVQACIPSRHLSSAEKALFVYDHLEGEASTGPRSKGGIQKGF